MKYSHCTHLLWPLALSSTLLTLAAAQAQPAAAAPTKRESTARPAQVAKRYAVILQTSSDFAEPLTASIPAALQDSEVFTARRTSEGRTLYDIKLGYFSTLPEAERAQQILLARFPNASVVPMPP